MDEISLNDFVNSICLKSQLINVDEKELLEIYSNYDYYTSFLTSVSALIETDSAFLTYDDYFIKKITSIIQLHRFDIKDDTYKVLINDIICYFNKIKAYDPSCRKLLNVSYQYYNENTRKISISDPVYMLYSIGYDAVVYTAITEGSLDLITEDDMFLASINYFLETVPSIFLHEDVRRRTLSKIKELEKKGNVFDSAMRRYSRQTRKNFQKLKLKGE